MKTVTVEVENNNLVLANDAIEKLGWRESTRLQIKENNGKFVVRPRELTQKEIADSACIYLIKHVGDATAVKTPIWKDGKWRIEVVLSYRSETIGGLTFSPEGELIEDESDSPAKLKGASL